MLFETVRDNLAKQFEIDPEKCVSCGTCAENCPVKAIKNDEE